MKVVYVLLVICVACAPAVTRAEPGVTAVKQQSFENDGDSDSFAYDVAVDGDTLVISDDERDTSVDYAGVVHVYRRQGDSWRRTDQLQLANPTDGAQFGVDVALQGDTLLVGAVGWRDTRTSSAGEVHVFNRSEGSWSRTQKIQLEDREEEDGFGTELAIAGDMFVAAAPEDRVDGEAVGAVHVYRRSDGRWSHRAKLSPSDGAPDGLFGTDLAVAKNSIFVGDWVGTVDGTERAGRVYLYREMEGRWSETRVLSSPNTEQKGHFGSAVAADGRSAFVAAPGESSEEAEDAGAVYVYRLGKGGWEREHRFRPRGAFDNELFGSALALEGDRALIGNRKDSVGSGDTITNTGSVGIYGRSGGAWNRTDLFQLEECPPYGTEFGAALDLSGNTVAVSAAEDDLGSIIDWTAHVFELVPDADGDDIPDSEDSEPMAANGEDSQPECSRGLKGSGGGCGCGGGAPGPTPRSPLVLVLFGGLLRWLRGR